MNSEEIENPRHKLDLSDSNENEYFESQMPFNEKTPQIHSLINTSFQCEEILNRQINPVSNNLEQHQEIYIEVDATTAKNFQSGEEYNLVPISNRSNEAPLDEHNLQPLQPLNQQDCIGYSQINAAQWPFLNSEKPSTSTGPRDENEQSHVMKPKMMTINEMTEIDKENYYASIANYPMVQGNGMEQSNSEFNDPDVMPPPSHLLPRRSRRSMYNRYLSESCFVPVSDPSSSSQNKSSDEFCTMPSFSSSTSDMESLNDTKHSENFGLNSSNNNVTNVIESFDNCSYYVPSGQAREEHNQKERRRRHRIKVSCHRLRSLVPGLQEKSDKATVLESTVRFLNYMKNKVGNNYDWEYLQGHSSPPA